MGDAGRLRPHILNILMMKKHIHIFCFVLLSAVTAFAGNPDRQGEAGAAELLLNPWARSAGVHSMSTASVTGVESMRINIAGLSRISKGELSVSNTRLYEGTDIGMSAVGFASKVGGSGAFGLSLVAMNFGDIPVTTVDQPEGLGGTYSPNFFNLGLGYAYTYKGKEENSGSISVGILVRAISQSIPDLSAGGFAVDAGVQYVSGEQDNFKLGISLRNVGTPMNFGGEGLTFRTEAQDPTIPYDVTVAQLGQEFELPSVLNIGLSYDFYFGEDMFLRTLGNFTSNAFSSDNIGVGAEFNFRNLVTLRGAYKTDIGGTLGNVPNVYTGLAGGISVDVPLKRAENRIAGIDYAYRATNPFRGTHNFSVRLGF